MDVRPLTVALDTVDAKDCKKGDLVMDENYKLIEIKHIHSLKGFIYIELATDNTWFLKESDQIRRVRR